MQGRDKGERNENSRPRQLVSSGGVIFRTANNVYEVALISTGEFWCLPKGLVEEGETFEEAALREVEEETGLAGEIVEKIGEINYGFYRKRYFSKTVHFYLLRQVGGSITSHDSEADDVRWFPLTNALQALAYPNEKKILAEAEKMLTKGNYL